MNRAEKTSLTRAIVGGGLALAAGILYLSLYQTYSDTTRQQEKAANQAKSTLKNQKDDLEKLQKRANDLKASKARMEEVLANVSQESEGQLKWKLRKTLHELGAKHGIRIPSIKYGTPTREGAKGTDLEAIDVELIATGVYQSIKAFMHSLESCNLPFGISNGRMEENPDGLRMTLTLRAFRRTGITPKAETKGEGA